MLVNSVQPVRLRLRIFLRSLSASMLVSSVQPGKVKA